MLLGKPNFIREIRAFDLLEITPRAYFNRAKASFMRLIASTIFASLVA